MSENESKYINSGFEETKTERATNRTRWRRMVVVALGTRARYGQ